MLAQGNLTVPLDDIDRRAARGLNILNFLDSFSNMAGGGARPGAGRPRGLRTNWRSTLDREAAYALYREEVLKQMGAIVAAQVQAATGVYEVLAVTSKGLVRVTDPAMLDRL
jgi:hypothetical protein